MSYSAAQLARYNTKPANRPKYSTIEFYNPFAGHLRILASGVHGPYRDMNFLVDDNPELFKCVRADVPDTTTQDVTSSRLGTVNFSRVSTQAYDYIMSVIRNAPRPVDRVIEVKIRIYEDPFSEPIHYQECFAGHDGISMDHSNVSVVLELENPAKIQYTPFYDIAEYTALKFG